MWATTPLQLAKPLEHKWKCSRCGTKIETTTLEGMVELIVLHYGEVC